MNRHTDEALARAIALNVRRRTLDPEILERILFELNKPK